MDVNYLDSGNSFDGRGWRWYGNGTEATNISFGYKTSAMPSFWAIVAGASEILLVFEKC
jgi:hypothetical protein